MTNPQLVVVVARQRSGTTALAETMAKGADLTSFGEVFHHKWHDGDAASQLHLHPKASFFAFRIDLLRQRPELSFPSTESQTAIFDAFIDHLASLTAHPWMLIDVKYNSWHHFEHVYSVTGQAPFLLHLLRRRNAAFAHVVRERAFERYCSERLALQRHIWHSEVSETADAYLIVDPVAAMRDMVEGRRQVEAFSRFLSATPRRIELRYESLYDGESLTESSELKLERLLGGNWTKGTAVPLAKVTPSLKDVVSNRDEVLAYFANTTFRDEVFSALGAKV